MSTSEKSNTKKSATRKKASANVTEDKWGKLLTDEGFTTMPNVIIENQSALGLEALDFAIISVIAKYWWTRDGQARPSKSTMAKMLGVQPRSVQRRIAAMENAGIVARTYRYTANGGQVPSFYSLEPLIAKANLYAEKKKTARIEKHERERRENAAKAGLRPTAAAAAAAPDDDLVW